MCLFCLVSSHLNVAVFFSKQACVRFDFTQPVVGFKCFSLKGWSLGFPVLARQKMRKNMLGFKPLHKFMIQSVFAYVYVIHIHIHNVYIYITYSYI